MTKFLKMGFFTKSLWVIIRKNLIFLISHSKFKRNTHSLGHFRIQFGLSRNQHGLWNMNRILQSAVF
jgi:hypothetical protein